MARKVHIRTFGCQMNVHDSARMVALMRSRGWEETADAAEADLIVVNTCSVREKAYRKVRSAVGAFKCLTERAGRRPVIAVAGCVARQEGQRWLEYSPHLDIVLGPDAIGRLAHHVEAILDGAPPVVDVQFDRGRSGDFLPLMGEGGPAEGATAYVTVMKGCSHHCTFCIVPSVRGPMRHRPAADIIQEVRDLVGRGVREVTLLGQTVNAWREGDHDFAWLLGRLDEIQGLRRLRYTSPHPIYMTDSLVDAHGRLPSLCEHVHLPLQSGSDRVLRRMGRRHDREDYRQRIRALREATDGFCVSTDLIVGFPGETEEDFSLTLELVEDVAFDTFFSFMYSVRPGTSAARWPDDVAPEVKKRRLHELHALGDTLTSRLFASDLGRSVPVLVEGPSRAGRGQLTGRTRTNRIVNFTADPEGCRVGDMVDVVVEQVMPHCLVGRVP